MGNEARFWRARDEYYDPPDDDFEDCEECDGSGELDHDCGEDSCCCLEPEPMICDRCEGEGTISKTQRRREIEEARADYEYDCWKDRKLEEA